MLIKNLISPLTDPTARIDVATTVNYLFSVYLSGDASEAEVRSSLREVCETVLRVTHAGLTEEELRDRVDRLVDDFMKAFKLEAIRHKTLSSIRPRYGLP